MFKAVVCGAVLSLVMADSASATISLLTAPPYPIAPNQTVSTATAPFQPLFGLTTSGDARIVGSLPLNGMAGVISPLGTPYTITQANGSGSGGFNISRPNINVPQVGLLVMQFTLTANAPSTLAFSVLDSGANGPFEFDTTLIAGANTFYFLGELQDLITNLQFRSSANNITQVSNLAVVTAPTPEPATWAMLILGFGAIGMAMRRRRQNRGGAEVGAEVSPTPPSP